MPQGRPPYTKTSNYTPVVKTTRTLKYATVLSMQKDDTKYEPLQFFDFFLLYSDGGFLLQDNGFKILI